MRRPFTRRGTVLLAVLLVLAAVTLLVLMTVELSGSETSEVVLKQHDQRAFAIAEVGLERTRAYLDAILEEWGDFDRALDPSLDDTCSTGSDPSGDDHLPRFTDGVPVSVPAGDGRELRFLSVPWPSAAEPKGAYLVRVDDNDDDDAFCIPSATSNSQCPEGRDLPRGSGTNPVRDCDRLVRVTVVGLTPALDFATARARHTLRVLAGRKEMAGVLAGGSVEASPGSSVCGSWADVQASGRVSLDAHCGSCTQECREALVTATTSGTGCRRGGPGPCETGAPIPRLPAADPMSPKWWPGACSGHDRCTPFYRVALAEGVPRVRMWSYALPGCSDPRHAPSAAECWKEMSNLFVSRRAVYVSDGAHGLDSPDPQAEPQFPNPDDPTTQWREQNRVFVEEVGVLSYSPGAPPGSDTASQLPHGVWLLDVPGLTLTSRLPMSPCGRGAWQGASLLVMGSVLAIGDYSFVPPHDLDVALIAAGDFILDRGSRFSSCDTGAAVLAHGQVGIWPGAMLEAPVLAENGGPKPFGVSGTPAVWIGPGGRVGVSRTPLVSTAPLVSFSWQESSL